MTWPSAIAAIACADAKRFWARVDSRCVRRGDCWLWLGCMAGNAPQMRYRYRHVPVTRRVYGLHIGDIPEGTSIYRTCLQPRCIAANHLVAMTTKEWCRQEDHRKRMSAAHHASSFTVTKITRRQAEDIRAMYAVGGILMKTLAKVYRVSPSTIGNIVNRFSHRDFGEEKPKRIGAGQRYKRERLRKGGDKP